MKPPATCEEAADLAALVALDVAEPADRRGLERHLAQCPGCAAFLDEFRATAASLGAAVPPASPPVELRDRVMAAALRDRTRPRRLWGRFGSLARRPAAAAWGAVAASIVISLGSLVWIATLQRQVASLQSEVSASQERAARYERVVQVLGSHQLAVRRLTPAVQTIRAGGMAYLDPASGSGMLAIHDLPQPPPGRAWQLWFVRGTGERVSGGMLWPDSRGNCYAMIAVPPDIDSFDALGITEEPMTGSQWPTSPRVMTAELTGSAADNQ